MNDNDQQSGFRRRIIPPAPPSPVPARRELRRRRPANDRSLLKQAPSAEEAPGLLAAMHNDAAFMPAGTAVKTRPSRPAAEAPPDDADGDTGDDNASDSEVLQSSGSMAIATLLSRLTGFLRNMLITASLGGAIASAFNTANQLPNIITEIVLGAVLTSLVVPVLVRAEKEDPDHGEAFIRRLFTLSVSLLGAVTILSVILAPNLVKMALSSESKVNLAISTSFAYWLLPQIFFYGVFALLMAVLNTKNVFKPGAWAPVINNIITLTVLVLYWVLPGELDPKDHGVGIFNPHVLLLGIGTTTGVIVQALIMLRYIKKSRVSLKPLWGIDSRLKQFGGMAAAIVVYVGISQFGYFVTSRIAASADALAPNIYQQAWLLLQVPYGIIGVTLLTAIMPRLSRNAADGDDKAVVEDLVMGSKMTYIALIPIVIFFTIFGTDIAKGLFAYGKFDVEAATVLGWTLSFSAFTLLPYSTVLLHLRVFYAREEAWTPTFIIAGITVTKVALSWLATMVGTEPQKLVILLGAANGFGFVAGALIGGFLLRRQLGDLGTKQVTRTCVWALMSSLVGGSMAFGLHYLLKFAMRPVIMRIGSIGFILDLAITGVIFLVITGIVLSRSGLPELSVLSRVARRIPGLSRFIAEPERNEYYEEVATPQLRAAATYVDDTFNATPVPPPMSAGIVRGPRLVPGAEVSDGSFRLLADHGSVPGARFWHAREKATGKEVALTFVDTSGLAPMAPATPAAARAASELVAARTMKLGRINNAAIASDIEVRSYRSGCLVIAEWVPGSSLAAVAHGDVNPYAAAHAMQPLVEASQVGVLGLDNHARIRINTQGIAVLAFPAVLESASHEKDLRSIRTALSSLIDAPTAPPGIHNLLTCELEDMPEAYSALMMSPSPATNVEQPLEIEEEEVPQVTAAPGFGRGYSRMTTGIVLVGATILVIIAAMLTAFLITLFNQNKDSPLRQDSLTSRIASPPKKPDELLPIKSASAWGLENPTAAYTIDDNPATMWETGPETGLVLSLNSAHRIKTVVLSGVTQGTNVQVIGLDTTNPTPSPTSSAQITSTINQLLANNVIGSVDVNSTKMNVDIKSTKKFNQILLWVVTPNGSPLVIKDITVVGEP